MWRLALGTLLSVLPARWRQGYGLPGAIRWERATVLSGAIEMVAALALEVVWYSHSVTTWARVALESALEKAPPVEASPEALGLTAFGILTLHPLTWLIGYFAIEGAVRLLAAVAAEQSYGTAPLAIADWIFGKVTGREAEGDALYTPTGKQHLQSMAEAVKDQIAFKRLPELADEIREWNEGSEEFLEIRASRPKAEWNPPRVVRVDEKYFRLENAERGTAPRPFVFRLRRLPAGVPGRTVIVYERPA
jgi:hypothetical protein